MRGRRILIGTTAAVALLLTSALGAGATSWERADMVGQGPDGEVVVDGAAISRSANGLTAQVSMPTPEPNSYTYSGAPSANGYVEGSPEAFTLWVFIFYNPEECHGVCDEADMAHNPDVIAGGYAGGGHLVAGPNLTITGHVNHRSAVFPPPGASMKVESMEEAKEALGMDFDIANAEVHLAIAPHGALDPELMPAQIKTPAGPPSLWWVATFGH